MIRLIHLLVMERSLPSEWLQNIIGLLVQIGPNCITSPSSEVTQIYLETCKMVRMFIHDYQIVNICSYSCSIKI